MVHEHLRPPAQDAIHHGANFRLALREQVAVHVEAVMAVSPRDTPGLGLLECPWMIGTHGDGVVPGGEALVTVGVRRRVQHDDHRLQDLERLRLVRRRELVGDLHGGFEPRRLVAVHRVVEHRDGGALRRDRGSASRRGFPGVAKLGEAAADLVELGEVRRIGDDQRADRPILCRFAPGLDAHAIARGGDQGVEIVLHYCVHGVLLAGGIAGDSLGPGNRGPVGAPGVEVERFLGGQRRRQNDQQK